MNLSKKFNKTNIFLMSRGKGWGPKPFKRLSVCQANSGSDVEASDTEGLGNYSTTVDSSNTSNQKVTFEETYPMSLNPSVYSRHKKSKVNGSLKHRFNKLEKKVEEILYLLKQREKRKEKTNNETESAKNSKPSKFSNEYALTKRNYELLMEAATFKKSKKSAKYRLAFTLMLTSGITQSQLKHLEMSEFLTIYKFRTRGEFYLLNFNLTLKNNGQGLDYYFENRQADIAELLKESGPLQQLFPWDCSREHFSREMAQIIRKAECLKQQYKEKDDSDLFEELKKKRNSNM